MKQRTCSYPIVWVSLTNVASVPQYHLIFSSFSWATEEKYQQNATRRPRQFIKMFINVIKVSWALVIIFVLVNKLGAIAVTLALVRRLNEKPVIGHLTVL